MSKETQGKNNEKAIAEQMAEISVNLKFEDIDQRTVDNAKIFMLDCLGCILSGSQIESGKSVRAAALNIEDDGECTVIGTNKKTNPMLAALINGTTGHSQDYDDDHREGTQHSSVAVLPAVWPWRRNTARAARKRYWHILSVRISRSGPARPLTGRRITRAGT